MQWFRIEECNFCESKNFTSYLESEGTKWYKGKPLQLAQCDNCSLVFSKYQPDPYRLYKSRLRTSDIQMEKAEIAQQNQNKIETAKSLIERAVAKLDFPATSLFDMGCGAGSTLLAAKEMGLVSAGNDIDLASCQMLSTQGFDVCHGFTRDLKFSNDYEIVTAIHYLEFSFEPFDDLLSCCQLLKPNGVLYLKSLYLDCPEHLQNKESWAGFRQGHFWYYKKKSLLSMLETAGFEILECNTDQHIEVFAKKQETPVQQNRKERKIWSPEKSSNDRLEILKQILQDAHSAYAQSDFHSASTLYEQVIDSEMNIGSGIFCKYARALENKTPPDIQSSIKVLETAGQKHPTKGEIWEQLATLHFEKKHQLVSAVNYAKQALTVDQNSGKALELLGQIELEKCNKEVAAEYFKKALECPSSNRYGLISLFSYAKIMLSLKRPDSIEIFLEKARAFNKHSQQVKWVSDLLDNYVEEESKLQEQQDFRMIGLCGISYCGSTYLGHLLGLLPSVFHIGESHRLTKTVEINTSSPQNKEINDYDSLNGIELLPCVLCGENRECKIFDHKFRMDLAQNKTNWFSKIAARAHSDILISGDKSNTLYAKLDPLFRHDSLVLFKSPINAYRSFYKRFEDNALTGRPNYTPQQFSKIWLEAYVRHINFSNPDRKTLFLSWEAFTKFPEEYFKAICLFFDLPYDDQVFSIQDRLGHSFGGNQQVNKFMKNNETSIRDEEKIDISSDAKQYFNDSQRLTNLYKFMLRQHDIFAKSIS